MQTFLLNKDPVISAVWLDQSRRHLQIVEGIHLLASMLGAADQLKNPRPHLEPEDTPLLPLWAPRPYALFHYTLAHFVVQECMVRGEKALCPAAMSICRSNIEYLGSVLNTHLRDGGVANLSMPPELVKAIPTCWFMLQRREPLFYSPEKMHMLECFEKQHKLRMHLTLNKPLYNTLIEGILHKTGLKLLIGSCLLHVPDAEADNALYTLYKDAAVCP